MNKLRETKTPIPPLEASKWLSIQVLLAEREMERLIQTFSPLLMVKVGQLVRKGEGILSQEMFLDAYKRYTDTIASGKPVDITSFRPFFSVAWSRSLDPFLAYQISDEKEIVNVKLPVIQLQAHSMGYSDVDGKFRPLVFGSGSIAWGIQFSYPQLFHDAKVAKVYKVDDAFENTSFFKELQRWMRQNSIPTPIHSPQGKSFIPIRIGKECFSWINAHRQLKENRLVVECP